MAASGSPKPVKSSKGSGSLMVRLDADSKRFLAEAAELRQISVSDYVRTVTVAQARREVQAAQESVIALTADEQLAFWNALNEPIKLTAAQKRLGAIARGER
jgi:uncharacterized protein (DUF1778 family)